jgi:hypothetical protein
LGFRGFFFRAVLFVLVAVVDMADVADRTWVSTEQELLEQDARAQVPAWATHQLAAPGSLSDQ